MINSDEMAQSIVETLMDRGLDFIIEVARKFVEDNVLKRLSSSQMSSLKSTYEKYPKDYAEQKKEVGNFIAKQKEKDEKRRGDEWAVLGDKLYERIFEFSPSERDKVREIIEKLCGLENDVELVIRFDTNISKSKQWLEETLDPLLSRRIFNAIYTYYRCKKDGLSIPEIKE